jgi:membrane fusion protein, multidrug efflux system
MSKSMRILGMIRVLVILVLVFGTVGVVAALVFMKLGEVKPPASSIDGIHARDGVPVSAEDVRRHTFVRYLYCDGDVVARERAMLRAALDEIVETVTVLPGEPVKKGQVLVTFRRKDIDSQITAAETARKEARENHRRYKELRAEGVATPEQVERAETAEQEAESRCALLESRLGFTVVRSPIDGVVEERWVEPGEKKNAKDELISVIAPAELDVRALVPERYRADLTLGMDGEFQFVESDGDAGAWIAAKITRMAPSTTDANRFFEVYLKLDEPGRALPGRYVELRFGMGTVPDALSVSSDALVFDGPRRAVFIVEADTAQIETEVPDESGLLYMQRVERESRLATMARGVRKITRAAEPNGPVMKKSVKDVLRVRRVAIQTGIRDEERVHVTTGELDESARVVLLPLSGLRDGAVVRIIETEQGDE